MKCCCRAQCLTLLFDSLSPLPPPSLPPSFLPSPCSSSVCLHSLDPERKFLSVFVNDKLINNSSTRAAPSGPRIQGDRCCGGSDWPADIMYPMKRLPFVAIQQPGAAESASSRTPQSVIHTAAPQGGIPRDSPPQVHGTPSVCRQASSPETKPGADRPWSFIRTGGASARRCDSLTNNSGSPCRCMNERQCLRKSVKGTSFCVDPSRSPAGRSELDCTRLV